MISRPLRANTFSGNQQQAPPTQQKTPPSAPPPIPPAIKFFIVVNGQQNGPHDIQYLKNLLSQGQLTKETLTWREGMTNWTPAGQVSELSSVFGSVPPPIPIG